MVTPLVSFLRQLDIFNPDTFRYPCHVLGVGAVGSRVIEQLARLGVPDVHAYDADTVQNHNVPSSAFYPEAVGTAKAEAITRQLASFPDTRITPHLEVVGESHQFLGVVFVCGLLSTNGGTYTL